VVLRLLDSLARPVWLPHARAGCLSFPGFFIALLVRTSRIFDPPGA